MKNFSKSIFSVTWILIIMLLLAFSVSAESGKRYDVFCNHYEYIMSMSHRGVGSQFPANSLEAVMSSVENDGADMVSISVRKTVDDVLVLCEDKPLYSICKTDISDISSCIYDEIKDLKLYTYDGTVTDFTISTLKSVVENVADKAILVIDNAWELRENVYNVCRQFGNFENVILRTDAKSKEITSWIASKGDYPMQVIGIYDGNIVFNAISHLNCLSSAQQSAVQYQSKNYFNVMYDNLVTGRFNVIRAIAPMYDKDLCGQRTDNVVGWDEMISKGFSIIETNNTKGLNEYISQRSEVKSSISELVDSIRDIDLSPYSAVSVKNFNAAFEKAENCSHDFAVSLGNMQQSMSVLMQAINNLTFSKGEDLQKGNLNITAGKIAAVIIFGALILAAEIYVHKMQKPKKH